MRNGIGEQTVQFCLDLLAFSLAWQISLIIQAQLLPILGFTRWSEAYGHKAEFPVVVGWWFVVALWAGVYRSAEGDDRWRRFVNTLHSAIAVTCAVILTNFFSAGSEVARSRSEALVLTPLCFLLFSSSRMSRRPLAAQIIRLWRPRGNVAVLGFDETAVSVLEQLQLSDTNVARGLILPESRELAENVSGVPVLGRTSDLAAVINREKLDCIVMLDRSLTEDEMAECTETARRMGVTVRCALGMATPSRNLNYSVHNGIPLLEIEPVRLTVAERLLKRGFDVVGSALMLAVLSPLMVVIAFLIKVTSEGPILFCAPRVGRGGRYFTFLKFRTMYANSSRNDLVTRNEKDGHLFKVRNDPRVTPVGRFLRRYSLDELPQLFNVLLGDMSLVGPRPLPIEDMEADGMSRRFAIWSEQRASVPPGITGLWQIRGRSELSFADLVKYDLEYVHNWSIIQDLRILLATPRFVVTAKGAF